MTYGFKTGQPTASNNRDIVTSGDSATEAFATPWVKFVNTNICAQLSGDATDVTAVIERSDVNPGPDGDDAQIAPADDTGLSGDLTSGIAPNIYTEPGAGWWRINLTTVTGGTCAASLSGMG